MSLPDNIDYFGITYKRKTKKQLRKWRKKNCKRNIHLFDEVTGTGGDSKVKGHCWNHYLVCDACQLVVNIESVDQKYVKPKYQHKGYYSDD